MQLLAQVIKSKLEYVVSNMSPQILIREFSQHFDKIEDSLEEGYAFTGFLVTRRVNPSDCFIEDIGVLDPLLKLISAENQDVVDKFVHSIIASIS